MKNNKEATLKEWGELLDKMGLNDVSTTKINIARILDSDASRLLNMEMNKERYNQIIDEVYENYQWKQPKSFPVHPDSNLSKEEFINKCKVDPEFSKRWGIKIEERELSWENRSKLLSTEQFHEFGFLSPFTDVIINLYLNQQNIPTKLITITYNNETIEVYE